MLAKIAPPTHDFAALARYLIHGKPGTKTHPDRVAWIRSHHLPTDDPELAARLMTATAAQNPRCTAAAYHVMLAWHPNERPDTTHMQSIALQTLELAGLGTHQALIVGHGDTPHRHLHMLINRVNATTGKAWKTSHDYARFDRIMRDLAEAHGFGYRPAHTYNLDTTIDLPTQPNGPATYAAKRGANTTRPQWPRSLSHAYGERVSEQLDQAATWDDVEQVITAQGHRLEAKGSGLIVGNANSYSKVSRLGLTRSAKGFEKRFGETFAAFQICKANRASQLFTVDAVDIVKALVAFGLASRTEIPKAIEEVHAARHARQASRNLTTQLHADLRNVLHNTWLTPPPGRHCAPQSNARRPHETDVRSR